MAYMCTNGMGQHEQYQEKMETVVFPQHSEMDGFAMVCRGTTKKIFIDGVK